MAVSKEMFRKVVGHFATGITVVTTRLATGKPWGFTANSFTSVSLEPPLVLVCVDLKSESHRAMSESKHFAVNFLSDQQQELSKRFASRLEDRFEEILHFEGPHGSPIFPGCLGFIECEKTATHNHGDHAIIIGEVLEAKLEGGEPLLYYGSAYRHLAPNGEASR